MYYILLPLIQSYANSMGKRNGHRKILHNCTLNKFNSYRVVNKYSTYNHVFIMKKYEISSLESTLQQKNIIAR